MFRTVVNVTGDATVCSIIADGENMLDYRDKQSPTETFDLDS
jgi:Na+/H+-dicarboxylate symporter